MAAKTTSGSGFRPYSHIVLHPQLGRFSQKSQKKFQEFFLDILFKVEKFKNYLNELHEFRNFWYFAAVMALYKCAKIQ